VAVCLIPNHIASGGLPDSKPYCQWWSAWFQTILPVVVRLIPNRKANGGLLDSKPCSLSSHPVKKILFSPLMILWFLFLKQLFPFIFRLFISVLPFYFYFFPSSSSFFHNSPSALSLF
jgi:hypothetical protein